MIKIIRFALLAAGISIWIALPVVDAVARKLGPEPFVYRETGSGDNLWHIARKVAPGDGTSRNQVMFAILRKNPDAFQGGNINFLRSGVELSMPTAAEAKAESPEEVDKLASMHKSSWSSGQALAPQLYELPPSETSNLKVVVASSPTTGAVILPARLPSLTQSQSPAPPAPLPPIEPIAPWTASASAEPSKPNVPDAAASKADVTPSESVSAGKAGAGWGTSVVAVTLAWLVLVSLAVGVLYELMQRRTSAGNRTDGRGVRGQARPTLVEPADLSKVLPKIESVGELVTRSGAIGFADGTPDEREIDVKLRLAKAYVDVNRLRDAHQLLHEIRLEGAPRYRRFAEHLLASPSGPVA